MSHPEAQRPSGVSTLDAIRCFMASLSLELEEVPDQTDSVLYHIMGDMFDLDMDIEGDTLTISGDKRNIWSWLTFSMWYSVEAP